MKLKNERKKGRLEKKKNVQNRVSVRRQKIRKGKSTKKSRQ